MGKPQLLKFASVVLSVLVPAAWLFSCSAADDSGLGEAGAISAPNGGMDLCKDGKCTKAIDGGCDGGAAVRIKSFSPGRLPQATSGDSCNQVIDWGGSDAGTDPVEPPPSLEETHECPAGTTRVHVRDMWSKPAVPTLGKLPARPPLVYVIDNNAFNRAYGARQESVGCEWYSTCVAIAPSNGLFQFNALPLGCIQDAAQGASGRLDLSSYSGKKDVWVEYDRSGTALVQDYAQYGALPSDPGHFLATDDPTKVKLCAPGKPDHSIPAGATKLHVRWPWSDPAKTGYPGTGCGLQSLGFETPPYPSALKVQFPNCTMQAVLELENGQCPWYYVLVPDDKFAGKVALRYPDDQKNLFTPDIAVPAADPKVKEYWLGYNGAPDNTAMFGTACMNWSQRANAYYFYTKNPGPGYAGCGGDANITVDPCNPPVPDGYSTVHFRYIWAGQKIFTYFPKPALMPRWIVLEVNGGGGDKDVICYREADRPWFNCPVPNQEFKAGATWRAVDKAHQPEWNTVTPREFPAKTGEYWLRWYYGKPDIALTSKFKFYEYYPDGTGGDWSKTGDWGDKNCAPKPPPASFKIGYGGWFPYDETSYAYQYGASLSRTFKNPDTVQDLLNVFTFERYELWKSKYVKYDDDACGAGTARVDSSDSVSPTVSEGQGYGMAMAAAIGDKVLFDKLWMFTRHYLSQSAKKFCGGLMGWAWKGKGDCRPLDKPCDPDKEGCDGDKDSAFDGDVDIGIGLVYAAMQWPEYRSAAAGWLQKMECEIDTVNDGKWFYATPGDTWNKTNCSGYPGTPCSYTKGGNGKVNLSYYPPGYFRVFGDFLKAYLNPKLYTADQREQHRGFWYKTAETVYEMFERCYADGGTHPALVSDWGHYATPCDSSADNYNWSRALWRIGIDAAWFGNRTDLPENQPNSSGKYSGKTRMQAKVEAIQDFYANFYKKNPVMENANRFSSICQQLSSDGAASGCDPALGHNSYFVNTAMCAYVSVYDNAGATTPDIRREAVEEAVSTSIINDRYYQESIGVYTLMFLTGNFPNPMMVGK